MKDRMWHKNTVDATIVDYLLGELPETQRDEFEDRYFVDDALHEQVLAIEEEVIDAYVMGELPLRERASFEKRLLQSPEQRRKVAFAKALARSGKPDFRTWTSSLVSAGMGWRWAFAGAALAAGLVLLFTYFRPQASAPPTQAKIGTQTPVLAFALLPVGVRGEGHGNPPLVVPHGEYQIELQMQLKGETFQRYRATLENVNGDPVWTSSEDFGAEGNVARITVPSKMLRPGEYSAKLRGMRPDGKVEVVAGYAFELVEK